MSTYAHGPLTVRVAVLFFVPLILSTELHQLSHSLVHAFLARLGDPITTLAAFSIAFSFNTTFSGLMSVQVQAAMAGAGGLLITSLFFNPGVERTAILGWTLVVSLAVNLFLILGGEFGLPHASQVAKAAAHLITHGKYKPFYLFSLIGGLFCFAWSRELWQSNSAGLISLTLWCFEPNILAHGELITPDCAAT